MASNSRSSAELPVEAAATAVIAFERLPIRTLGTALVLLLAALLALAPNAFTALRFAGFDAYQRLMPRERSAYPVTIVTIDEAAIERLGHWPWGRDQFAKVIDAIAAHEPLAIGLDIIFPEPDPSSPDALAVRLPNEPSLQRALAALPSNDTQLAQSFARTRVVAAAVLHNDDYIALRDARVAHGPTARLVMDGGDPMRFLRDWKSAMRTIPELEQSALGVATLTAEPDNGVVRRVPMLQRTRFARWPSLSAELLRVGSGASAHFVTSDRGGVVAMAFADRYVPTDADGKLWVHFAPSDRKRILSASDLLKGKFDPAYLQSKFVLIGFAAFGLLDVVDTPLGDRRPGVEVHAEVLENILEGQLLSRLRAAIWLEVAALLLFGVLTVWAVPRLSALGGLVGYAIAAVALAGIGVGAFHYGGLLFDAVSPILLLGVVYVLMSALTLARTERRRRALATALQAQREARARLEGELEAAERIQLGLLPKPEIAIAGETRADIAAFIQPSRTVGGDLYDFFMLDADRLFLTIGDVSGKGVPASLFMALAKSLTKSSALRDDAELQSIVTRAQREIARDNPEFMFVTLAAFVIDLRSGLVRYVNAGHETPLWVNGNEVVPLEGGGGPPICVDDDFEFSAAEFTLTPGDRLLLVTDGVTEALDPHDAFYGRDRIEEVITRARSQQGEVDAAQLVAAVHGDVMSFAAGRELPDDIALVAFTWHGPSLSA